MDDFQNKDGVALGVASLTVIEQGSMLATIDDNGVYHDPHLITSISQNSVQTPIKITSRLVFSPNPTQNAELDSQVQYAMSEDTNPSYGTAPNAALSNGQPIIAKTGTTEYAQSAFFVGAIPSQALTVALFTGQQNDCNPTVTSASCQTLNNLGGLARAVTAAPRRPPSGTPTRRTCSSRWGWRAPPAVFTGQTWNQVPPGLRVVAKPPAKKKATQAQNPPAARTPTRSSGAGAGTRTPTRPTAATRRW